MRSRGRCPSECDGVRCLLPDGHDSAHAADLGDGVVLHWVNTMGVQHPRAIGHPDAYAVSS